MKQAFLVLFLGILLQSCENEIHVTADWKEIPVVYGLINPAAEYNYIRINRAYLNEEGNALSYASEPDSINFDDLLVRTVEYKDGIERNTIIWEKVEADSLNLGKDVGLFANSPHYLYRSAYKFNATDFRGIYEYKLEIVNNETDKQYTSRTISPGFLEFLAPVSPFRQKININEGEQSRMVVSYREGPYVKMYDLVMRFRYWEFPEGKPEEAKLDSIDWRIFTGKVTKRIEGYSDNNVIVNGNVFYDLLNVRLEADSTIQRRVENAAFMYYGVTEDLYTYIQVNQPSIGIVQKKPEFSNISDGLGIFAGRYVSVMDSIQIQSEMVGTLQTSERTAHLNFIN